MKKHIPVLIIILFLFISESMFAEEKDTTRIRQVDLNEVVVKSFKQNRDLRLEPVSATIVNGTAISNRNISGIKEFSSFIPNLFMPDYGSKLTSPVYIRGIGSKINSPSVGLYVDGIPYFEKSAFDFDFAEIDRIEVLRGPQGTLYGRNTMGGIINIYTKSPLKYQSTNIWLSNGNYGYREYALSRYKTLSNKFGYAISGKYSRNDGYFTNLFNNKKADPSKEGSARIRLEWKPTPPWLITLTSTYDNSKQGGYPYAVCDSITHKPGKVNYNDYSYYKRQMSTTGLSVGYDGKGYRVSSQTAFQWLKDHQGIDQDFSPASLYFAKQDQVQKMVSEEINIKSINNNRYKWLFGVFGFWQSIDNTVILDYLKAGYTNRKYYDRPTSGIAVYHQSIFDDLLVKNLSLTVGLRYDFEHTTHDYLYYKDTKEESKEMDKNYAKLNFSQLTPKFSLQYLFPSGAQIYTTVAKGYKTGGFNTSFDKDDDRTFKPETSWNYEIGAKHPFLDNRVRAEISLFFIDWKHQQISQYLSSGIGSLLTNAGHSQSKGIELSLQANPCNGLLLQANYGYTHATFKDYTDKKKDQIIDYSGNYLPMVPINTFSLGMDYTISNPCNHIDRFIISVNYTGTGKINWKEDNLISQPYYGLLNAKFSATKEFITFALWAKNITNSEYSTFYFESGGNGLAQKGRPFTIGGNIQLNF